MLVNRSNIVRHLERNGFYLCSDGGNHSIYFNGLLMVPLKHRSRFDSITANRICKQAEIEEIFKLPRAERIRGLI